MSIPNHIQQEIQKYKLFVEEMQKISTRGLKKMLPKLTILKELEKREFYIKDYIIKHGVPTVSADEFYSIFLFVISQTINFDDQKKDISEKNDDPMELAAISLSLSWLFEYYIGVAGYIMIYLMKHQRQYYIPPKDLCITDEDALYFSSAHSKGQRLKTIFESLKQNKDALETLFHQLCSTQQSAVEIDEDFDGFLLFFNELIDLIQDDDYEHFKETVYMAGIESFYEFFELISPHLSIASIMDIDSDSLESEFDITLYLSMNNIIINEDLYLTPMFCRTALNFVKQTMDIIESLPSEAKKAIESYWEDDETSWFKNPFKRWVQDQFQIISESIQNQTEKSEKHDAKSDHLNTPFSRIMIKKLAKGLVKGSDSPPLPCLVSSKDGEDDAINKLVYLFTGRADIPIKHPIIKPHNLVWEKNYTLNNLKLLIYLLLYEGEFENNDPLKALDEGASDGISEFVKLGNTGRKSIFPIVEDAFGKGKKSVQNAPKPRGGNQESMKQIALFWFYCKNMDD